MPAVVDFVPRRLIGIRERVQELHPGTADAPPPPEAGLVEELRSRIVDAVGANALERLAESLSPREVRAVVGGLEHWADLYPECSLILRRRANARLLPLLWGTWQRRPGVEEIRSLLLELGDRFGWIHAVAEAYVEAAPDWVAAPGLGVQRYLDAQGLSASDLPDLAGRPVQPDSPLARLVREAVLTDGSLRQLRDDHGSVLEWQRELGPENAIDFGQHYLSTMPDKEWTEPLVNALHGRYGTPRKPKLERFWEPLSEDVKKAFQRRHIRKRIQEEFQGDDDRGGFWLRWAAEMEEVTKGWAGSTRYAEIEFDNAVVFEFFETGNAAYFYTPEDARAVKRGGASAPRDLKERKRYRFLRGSENRLIHNPPWGWWDRGDRMVALWLRKSGGGR